MHIQEMFVLVLLSFCLPFIHGQNVVVFNAGDQSAIRDPTTGIFAGQFIETKSKRLNVSSLKDVFVTSKNRCQYECLKDSRCKSYNIAVLPNSVGQYKCQILDKEMINFSQSLIHDKSFHHYSIKNKCSPLPCVNHGKCIPHFNNNSYTCECNSPHYGEQCEGTLYWSPWTSWSAWTVEVQCSVHIRTRRKLTCSGTHPIPPGTNAACVGPSNETEHKNVNDPTTGCDFPLGMESGCIDAAKVTASTRVNKNNKAQNARLNLVLGEGAWTGYSRAGEYLQVDLTNPMTVTAFATQGRHYYPRYSKTIKLMYSQDMSQWTQYHSTHQYIFQANVDHLTPVKTVLPQGPIVTRGVRFVVLTFYEEPALRVELYGCK